MRGSASGCCRDHAVKAAGNTTALRRRIEVSKWRLMKPREESTAAQDRDRQRQRAADLAGNRIKMFSITSSGRPTSGCCWAFLLFGSSAMPSVRRLSLARSVVPSSISRQSQRSISDDDYKKVFHLQF